MPPLRLVFAGTPDFAVPALSRLLEGPHEVVGVLTQPDRPAGRGRQLTASPVKQLAAEAGVPVFQPSSLRKAAAREPLVLLAPDLMVVAAYGLILPAAVLQIPRLGCWNIHASLLPRWRGAAPIHRALMAGDRQTGVCIMQMDEGLDTGDVLASAAIPISECDTGQTLHDALARLGAELLDDCLGQRDQLSPQRQDPEAACYASKIDKAEAALDWRRPARDLERQIRAFNPWPVARARIDNQVLRVWQAEWLPELKGPPGLVMASGNAGIDVAAAQGGLRLTVIQRPGGRAMPAGPFLNACPIEPGQRFD